MIGACAPSIRSRTWPTAFSTSSDFSSSGLTVIRVAVPLKYEQSLTAHESSGHRNEISVHSQEAGNGRSGPTTKEEPMNHRVLAIGLAALFAALLAQGASGAPPARSPVVFVQT